MKKLLHVINSFGIGGAEKLLVGVINHLQDFEHHLLVLRGPVDLEKQLTNLSSFHNLNTHSFKTALIKLPAVKKIIREGRFDIVHSHLYEANIVARLAVPKKIRLFNSIHAVSSLASYRNSKASLFLERLTYKKRHHLIHVSKTVAADFDAHVGIKGPSTVLYNYVDDKFFQESKKNFSPDRLKLVAVGNLREQKNYPYLIEAFKKMPASVSLDIYGEGTMRSHLQSLIDQHNLPIQLKGIRDDLFQILPQYDLFVMSSFFEGQSLALLEAMACGLPALLSDIPVLREVGEKFALFFNLDDPLSLVNRITEVMDKKHDLVKMSRSGYAFSVEHAKQNAYMNKLKSLYLQDEID
jgi:glycosyltransferase involved in cell wall biosynthesis